MGATFSKSKPAEIALDEKDVDNSILDDESEHDENGNNSKTGYANLDSTQPCTTSSTILPNVIKECLEMAPKFFLDGWAWQLAANLSKIAPTAAMSTAAGWAFATYTGLAAGAGIFVGNYIGSAFKPLYDEDTKLYIEENGYCSYYLKKLPFESLLYAIPGALPIFGSGWIWQPIVNATKSLGQAGSAIITGLVCGSAFTTTLVGTRHILSRCAGEEIIAPVSKETLKNDARIGFLYIGTASACFQSTDIPILGNSFITNGNNYDFDTAKAGATTTIGLGIATAIDATWRGVAYLRNNKYVAKLCAKMGFLKSRTGALAETDTTTHDYGLSAITQPPNIS